MLEAIIKGLREATPEQLAPLSIRVEQKRKVPKHTRPQWINQKALQIFLAEKGAGKNNDDARKAVNKALSHLRLDVKIRNGKVEIEDTGPPTFTTRALVALNDRAKNGARRKARKRLTRPPA